MASIGWAMLSERKFPSEAIFPQRSYANRHFSSRLGENFTGDEGIRMQEEVWDEVVEELTKKVPRVDSILKGLA